MKNSNLNIPNHVAIIMDGNGTWATKKGLPRLEGHKAGVDALNKVIKNAKEIGIKYLTVYAFSTENWNRDKIEVDGLMNMLRKYLKGEDIKKLNDEKVRIRVFGNRTDKKIPEDILKSITEVEDKTKDNEEFNFNIAFNYGGRDEIIQAIKKIPANELEGLSEENFSQYLYSADIPDPNLIIRTSGQVRVSNFLLWQSAYSEFLFLDILWPDFDNITLKNAIKEYNKRKRKFGKI
ncbi:MAG: polyprenyl diphosphate synthase [Alphaproteobacteria bacterium]|jgi:undecaprenyl diphosphate synthase|nr:polyprenyl diphosphate synthase [Alphaproteobacteria bacterium]